jgi:hypothetical protein
MLSAELELFHNPLSDPASISSSFRKRFPHFYEPTQMNHIGLLLQVVGNYFFKSFVFVINFNEIQSVHEAR